MSEPHSPAARPAEPPIELPYYGAPLPSAIRRLFAKYATFRGRASRAEFWWATLFLFAVPNLIDIANGLITGDRRTVDSPYSTGIPGLLVLVFSLATLIPSFSVGWRRMHDTGRSGLWVLFGLIPIVGWITFLVFAVQGPRPEGQRFDAV